MSKSFSKRSRSRRELKNKAVKYKGGQCQACGYDRSVSAMTFHHKDPSEKDFTISELIGSISWSKIRKEIDKCYLLCMNCHSEVHEGILDGYMVIV